MDKVHFVLRVGRLKRPVSLAAGERHFHHQNTPLGVVELAQLPLPIHGVLHWLTDWTDFPNEFQPERRPATHAQFLQYQAIEMG